MEHVLVWMDFESGNSLTKLELGSGGVRWISVQKGEGDRVDRTEKWKRETHRWWRGSAAFGVKEMVELDVSELGEYLLL